MLIMITKTTKTQEDFLFKKITITFLRKHHKNNFCDAYKFNKYKYNLDVCNAPKITIVLHYNSNFNWPMFGYNL